jgi:hypothetical protein
LLLLLLLQWLPWRGLLLLLLLLLLALPSSVLLTLLLLLLVLLLLIRIRIVLVPVLPPITSLLIAVLPSSFINPWFPTSGTTTIIFTITTTSSIA